MEFLLEIILALIALGLFMYRRSNQSKKEIWEEKQERWKKQKELAIAHSLRTNKKRYLSESLHRGLNGPTPRAKVKAEWGKRISSDNYWQESDYFYTFEIPLENGNVYLGRPIPSKPTESNRSLPKNDDYVNEIIDGIIGNPSSTDEEQYANLELITENWPLLIELGGEIVPILMDIAQNGNITSQSLISQLLGDITRTTGAKFGRQTPDFLCEYCFVKYVAHDINLSWAETEITYFGCRACSQSRKYINHNGKVSAVLNNRMEEKHSIRNGTLRVNWIIQRTMFDFEEIEIIQATDEDVERFIVQLGNDTDVIRRTKYKEMQCLVSPECNLSDNTMRILRRTFENMKLRQMV